ncbi:MAG: glycine cleavage system protein GcvH [Proteobacteria bacterium]|nr:glycine cleavage system protein GcvH [Pseudomonadota bacterium]
MSFPKDLKYTREHEWIRLENGKATLGITAYALEQLGDVVHVELPKVGESYKAGASFGTIESTKTVSDLYMPVSAKVTAVNTEISKNLERLAEDPYKKGWLLSIEYSKEDGELISAAEYEKYIADEE